MRLYLATDPPGDDSPGRWGNAGRHKARPLRVDFLAQMSVEKTSQRSRDLQGQASPALGYELIFSAGFRSRGQSLYGRVVVIRDRFFDSPPASFVLHQAGVSIRGTT